MRARRCAADNSSSKACTTATHVEYVATNTTESPMISQRLFRGYAYSFSSITIFFINQLNSDADTIVVKQALFGVLASFCWVRELM